jgi:glycosyltransferase involved in cell wall biosynthesis
MRVVALIPGLPVGGAQRSLIKLLHVIAPLVSRIDLICLADADSRIAGELPDSVSLHTLGSRSSASPWLWFRVVRLLRASRPDLILGWSTYANFVAVLASMFVSYARLVLSERIYVPLILARGHTSLIRRLVVLALMRKLYPLADVITSNSSANTRFLRRYIGGQSEYRVLPNVVDLEALDARANQSSVVIEGITGPHVLAIGRLVHQKGFDILLRAFAIVHKSRPGWNLVIVGDGSEREGLHALSRNLGIEGSVRWLGEMANPFPFYLWADLVVVPSRYEGFPNVPLEAMSLGKAVICSDCRTGPRELTQNGKFGRLVPVGEPEALARAIIDIGGSPEVMRALGEAARRHVRSDYDVAAIRARYAEALGLRPMP